MASASPREEEERGLLSPPPLTAASGAAAAATARASSLAPASLTGCDASPARGEEQQEQQRKTEEQEPTGPSPRPLLPARAPGGPRARFAEEEAVPRVSDNASSSYCTLVKQKTH